MERRYPTIADYDRGTVGRNLCQSWRSAYTDVCKDGASLGVRHIDEPELAT
jgi:hypothetical protein